MVKVLWPENFTLGNQTVFLNHNSVLAHSSKMYCILQDPLWGGSGELLAALSAARSCWSVGAQRGDAHGVK